MAVTEVNGHVLLPHLPDWSRPVQWSRLWQTDVQRVLTGAEERRGLRPKPRESLSWKLIPFDVTEQTPLLARLRAAAKSGLACAPYWGRGRRVVSAAGTELVLDAEDEAWPWFQAEDYLLLRSTAAEAVEAFELAQVESVNGVTFTLTAALVGTWGEGTWAWPLVFGRLTFSDITHRTDWHAGVTVTLSELVVRPDPPSWVDICFLDPWGGCESWGNMPDQQFPAPFNPDSALLVEQAYTCLDPWTYTFWAVRGVAVRWTLANFAYVGASYTFANETLLIEWPPGFPTVMEECVAVSFGSAGGYETWRNLPDDEIAGSWDGEKNDLNPDWTVGGMPLWVPTVMT
ncbi:MAG: hypothetical protein HS113_21080 [Verrucomicrobiales bacterium]|nr:hypothetical protein [Verrucomicrobiales bacterium]